MSPLSPRQVTERRDTAITAVRADKLRSPGLLPRVRAASLTVANPAPTISEIRAVIANAYHAEPLEFRPFGPSWEILPAPASPGGAFPAFGASVTSLLNGEAVACAVLLLSFDETLTAAQGHGAELDGRLIHVASPRGLDGALVLSSEFTIATPPISEVVSRLSGWRMPSPRSSLLTLGSYLATGRLDGFTLRHAGLNAEPRAAALLVEEAGGVVDLRGPSFVAASTSALLEELLELTRDS